MSISDETMEQLQSYLMGKLPEQAQRDGLSFDERITRLRDLSAFNVVEPQTGTISRAFVERFLDGDDPKEEELRRFGLQPEQISTVHRIINQGARNATYRQACDRRRKQESAERSARWHRPAVQ